MKVGEKMNDANILFKPLNRLLKGRRKIILDYDEVTSDNVLEVLNKALPYHKRNVQDIEYLIKYFLGDQDILRRPAPETSNINNQVVVNYAFPITREIVGYTLGNPVELVQKNVDKATDVETISDIYDNIGSFLTDTCTLTYASICGVGYQITLPNENISSDFIPDLPFKNNALHPSDTFCVFSSKIGNPKIMSCVITHTENNGDEYTIYTKDNVFTITDHQETVSTDVNVIGMDPITMFENSLFMTGDWEQAISVMNASNEIASDSLNDIEGTIRSLLVLLGTEFEDDDTGLKQIKKNRLLTLTGANNGNVDAKFISPTVDSSSIENIRQYLEDARNIITGIPDRQTASGGDTGTAVLNRNGWTDIEIVAKLKELFFKKGKREQLGVAVNILKLLNLISQDTNVIDINITIGRHTTDNLQSKAQAFSTLVATGELATIDCLEMSGLTTRINEVVARGEQAKAEKQLEEQQTEGTNTTDTSSEKGGMNEYDQNKKKVSDSAS